MSPADKPHIPLPRLVPRVSGDAVSAIAVGRRRFWWADLYVELMDASWKKLMLVIAGAYVTINTIFAFMYSLRPGDLFNARDGSFTDAFFFSVQTFATIGYGEIAPRTVYANTLVSIEAFMGVAFSAMITGLVFAKFSRPTSRVMFSEVAVVGPYHGEPHLMLRLANERLNRIVNASIQMTLLIEENTDEGIRMRRFIDLPLVRGQVPFMLLTWTVMHKIDRDSPLYGITTQSLRERSAELIVSLTGVDESLSQTIHARYSYIAEEILFNRLFEDVITRRGDRLVEIDYSRFNNTRPYQSPETAEVTSIPTTGQAADAVPTAALTAEPGAEPAPEADAAVNADPDAPMAPALPRAEDDPAFAEFVKMCNPD